MARKRNPCSRKITFATEQEGQLALASESLMGELKPCEKCDGWHVRVNGECRPCWPDVKYPTEGDTQAAITRKSKQPFKCALCDGWHIRNTRRATKEQTTEQRFTARQKRQTRVASRRIAALKGRRTRITKHIELARLTFQRGSGLEPMFRAAMSARLFNALVFSWNAGIEQRRRTREQALGTENRRRVPKARGITLLDFPRVGPAKEGGRIPLREALSWHMTDAEVLHWRSRERRDKRHRSKPSISRATEILHSWVEPITYHKALECYAHEQHWKDADGIFVETIIRVCEIADRDLRLSAYRRETDGRKKKKKKKFTARTRYEYWTWLCLGSA